MFDILGIADKREKEEGRTENEERAEFATVYMAMYPFIWERQ